MSKLRSNNWRPFCIWPTNEPSTKLPLSRWGFMMQLGALRDSGWWEWERAAKTEWTHARARTLRSPVQLIDKVTWHRLCTNSWFNGHFAMRYSSFRWKNNLFASVRTLRLTVDNLLDETLWRDALMGLLTVLTLSLDGNNAVLKTSEEMKSKNKDLLFFKSPRR